MANLDVCGRVAVFTVSLPENLKGESILFYVAHYF